MNSTLSESLNPHTQTHTDTQFWMGQGLKIKKPNYEDTR